MTAFKNVFVSCDDFCSTNQWFAGAAGSSLRGLICVPNTPEERITEKWDRTIPYRAVETRPNVRRLKCLQSLLDDPGTNQNRVNAFTGTR